MASSSSSNPILFAFVSLVFFIFFLFSENKNFVSAMRSEEDSSELQHYTRHQVSLSSLFPSSSCTSPPQGRGRKGSLQVVHKHGPCSKLKQPSTSTSSSPFIIPHSEILQEDKARVRAIQSKLSKSHNHHQVETSKKGLDRRTQLPANSGILLGTGDYFVTVGLGSPKRDLSLIFDTGSDITWTQCKSCARSCYPQKEPIFDPSQSSSYFNIPCFSSLCSGSTLGCYVPKKTCVYIVRYGDGSVSYGLFAKETLTLSTGDVFNDFLFGCGQLNRGLFNGTAGLLGLGRSPVSFVQQTAEMYRKIFSYCLPSTPSSVGYINFGGESSANVVKYIPFSSNFRDSSFYGLDLIGIAVDGINLPISTSVFSSGTIIDSGTIITRLPPAAYSPLRDSFQGFMSARYPKGDSDDFLGTCYDLSGYDSVYIPTISLLFQDGVKVELDRIGTVYTVSTKQVCLGFAANEGDDDVAIIGNTLQKTLEVVYDVGGETIGFRPHGCN